MRRRRYQSKNKRRTLLRLGILLMIPLFILGLVIGAVRLLRSRNQDIGLTAVEFSGEDVYTYTGRGFLYYSGGSLAYRDDSDSKRNYTLSIANDGTEVGLAASESMSVLYNSSSALLVGMDYPVEFSGVVSDVACGESHFAVLKQESGGDSLQVFDSQANQVRQLDFDPASAYLVDFGFDTASEETLWTLTLDVSGGSPVCTVTTYNLDQSVTNGLMTIQDQLVERVCFARSSVFAVSTNYIIRYARVGNSEAYRTLIYGWEVIDASTSGSQPLFLLRQRGEEGYSTVKLVSAPETEGGEAVINMVQLPQGTLAAFLAGNRMIVYTAERQYSYDSTGKQTGSTALERGIEGARRLSDSRALLSAGGELFTAPIR